MAKLNITQPAGAPAAQAPQGAAPSQPVSFLPQPINTERKARAPRGEGKPKVAKVARVTGKAWFEANFAGGEQNVLQKRVYERRGGFKCAPCGIPGSTAYVIRAQEGKGSPIELRDPKTGEVTETINGFEVGATCLYKYAGIDVNKIGQQKPPAAESAKTEIPAETTSAA